MTPPQVYHKHFIPLESNPELFTGLIHKLGVDAGLAFHDVLSVTDEELLALVPRPVFALILVFPTSETYEKGVEEEDASLEDHDGCGEETVMWFRQTINNACGLYAVLHAVSNGAASRHISPNSLMSSLLQRCAPLKPLDRARVFEEDERLEAVYNEVALQGDSAVPNDPEEEVDFHYVCFVKSADGHLYEMDGDRKGPLDRGVFDGEDVLSGAGLKLIQEFIEREQGASLGFSLMALAPA